MNIPELGLGDIGATLAARVLPLSSGWVITDSPMFGAKGTMCLRVPGTASDLQYSFVQWQTLGRRFPYGVLCEADGPV